MKVLHVVPSLNLGGAERLALDICQGLRRRDIQVELVYFQGENHYHDAYPGFQPHKVEDHFALKLFRGVRHRADNLEKFVADLNPDIIHSHLFSSELRTRSLSINGKVWVTHLHDNMRQFQTGFLPTTRNQIIERYERYYLLQQYKRKGNNHFVSISRDTNKYFQSQLPKGLRENIVPLPNAIDLNRFTQKSSANRETLRMCNVGSFQPKKNQRFLLDVAKHLQNRIDFELHFVGTGELEESVRSAAQEMGLADCTIFHGKIASVENILSQANLYVHSAYYEPFGLVLLEAMASGLPVVCLDGKGNRDVVEDRVNGSIVESSSPNDYADAVLELWGDRQLYDSYVEAGLRKAEAHGMNAYLDNLVGLYTQWIRSEL